MQRRNFLQSIATFFTLTLGAGFLAAKQRPKPEGWLRDGGVLRPVYKVVPEPTLSRKEHAVLEIEGACATHGLRPMNFVDDISFPAYAAGGGIASDYVAVLLKGDMQNMADTMDGQELVVPGWKVRKPLSVKVKYEETGPEDQARGWAIVEDRSSAPHTGYVSIRWTHHTSFDLVKKRIHEAAAALALI